MEGRLQWLNGNIELNALTSNREHRRMFILRNFFWSMGGKMELVQVLHEHELTNGPEYRLILKAEKPLD